MQGTQVRPLVLEDATYNGAARAERYHSRARTPGARGPREEKPCSEQPATAGGQPCSHSEGKGHAQTRPCTDKNKNERIEL